MWNASATLPLAIRALLDQDYPREQFEIVCVDNGSTDGSVEVLRQFGDQIRIEHADRRGASAARNEGVRRARYPWIAFTDADCVPHADWLRALVRFATGPGRADLMGGRIVAHRPHTKVERFAERLFDQQQAVCEFRPAYVISANMLVNRETLSAFGPFDESFDRGQDVELSFRAFFRHGATFGYVDDAVVAHRHPRTVRELWRKACQHGKGSAWIIAKFADDLGESPWNGCWDRRRYRRIARLGARSIVDAVAFGRRFERGKTNPETREHFYELIVAIGKQFGFVRETVQKRLSPTAAIQRGS